jgi:hypothetical protein
MTCCHLNGLPRCYNPCHAMQGMCLFLGSPSSNGRSAEILKPFVEAWAFGAFAGLYASSEDQERASAADAKRQLEQEHAQEAENKDTKETVNTFPLRYIFVDMKLHRTHVSFKTAILPTVRIGYAATYTLLLFWCIAEFSQSSAFHFASHRRSQELNSFLRYIEKITQFTAGWSAEWTPQGGWDEIDSDWFQKKMHT